MAGMQRSERETTLVLNMIVRNERAVVARLLRSALPHVHAAVIVDTGSTDDTLEVIRAAARERWPEAEAEADRLVLLSRPFDSFCNARTHALRACEEHGKKWGATHALLLDADMVLVVAPGRTLAEIVAETAPAPSAPGGGGVVWYLQQRLGEEGKCVWNNVRVVSLYAGLEYFGSTHEVISRGRREEADPRRIFLPSSLARIDDVGDGGCKTRKFARDLYLLETYDLQEPRCELAADEPRSCFYAANSARSLAQVMFRAFQEETESHGAEAERVFAAAATAAPGQDMLARLLAVHAMRCKAMSYYRRRIALARGYQEERYISAMELAGILLSLRAADDADSSPRSVWQWKDVAAWARAARSAHPHWRIWERADVAKDPAFARLFVNNDAAVDIDEVMRLLQMSRRFSPYRLEFAHRVLEYLASEHYTLGAPVGSAPGGTSFDPYPLITQALLAAMPGVRRHLADPQRADAFLFCEKPVYDFFLFAHFARLIFYYAHAGSPLIRPAAGVFLTAEEAFRQIFAYPHLTLSTYMNALYNVCFYPDLCGLRPEGRRRTTTRARRAERILAAARDVLRGKIRSEQDPATELFASTPARIDRDTVLFRYVNYEICTDADGNQSYVMHPPGAAVETRNVVFHFPSRRYAIVPDALPAYLRRYQTKYRGGIEDVRVTRVRDRGSSILLLSGTRPFQEPWIEGHEPASRPRIGIEMQVFEAGLRPASVSRTRVWTRTDTPRVPEKNWLVLRATGGLRPATRCARSTTTTGLRLLVARSLSVRQELTLSAPASGGGRTRSVVAHFPGDSQCDHRARLSTVLSPSAVLTHSVLTEESDTTARRTYFFGVHDLRTGQPLTMPFVVRRRSHDDDAGSATSGVIQYSVSASLRGDQLRILLSDDDRNPRAETVCLSRHWLSAAAADDDDGRRVTKPDATTEKNETCRAQTQP